MRLFIFVVCLAITSVVGAQPSEQFWTPAAEANHYQLSSGQLELILNQAPPEAEHQQPGVTTPRLQLPGPDGGLVTFKFWESPVMAAGLAANFPGIRTFIGQRVDAPSVTLRLDYTYEGLHAMVMDEAGDWFIDPVAENDNLYQVRRKPARAPGDFVCEVEGQPIDPDSPVGTAGTDKSLLSPIGGNLQTYRIAVAATGEFSQYHGGTVEGALSAIATIMHRINGVYERDLACRMILVDSNHLVIFLDASEDPYTGDSGTRMNTNHEVLTDSIGLDNFDIGHVFDRGGGGIASLGSVCRSSRKGRGYTSTDPPTGDLFAIDYAAHELGHQYGANHTFNNCGGSGPQPYEPGSATTIMGYAGLCGSNNVALNSDDHFHNASLVEMSNYVILGFGSSCAQLIDNGNNGPTIDEMPPSGLTIPISTPFELTGVASDLDDDELTYCWEQFDTGDVSPLGSPTGNAPLFRSRSPTTSPTRVFPRMGAVLQGLEEPSEVLPFYQRGMTFRLTVRDNNPAGGGVEWAEMDVDVSAQAGPFEVTSQSTFTTWTAGTFQVITWDVAGTNQAPVNADSVNIYLSEPGGMTYPYLLAGPVPNDGEATILLPSGVAGNGFRIKVKGHGNIFFDLNDANISIVNPSAPGVAFAAFEDELTVCAPDTAFFPLGLSGLQDFADTVYLSLANLPAGLEATLSTNQLVPPAFLDLTCANTQAVSTGNYEIQVIAEAADTIHDTLTLLLNIISDPPAAPVLSSPALDEVEIATTPLLQWYPVPGASGYEVEVAADPDFNDVLFFGTTVDTFLLANNPLPDSSLVYWHVTSISADCGLGTTSAAQSFFTEVISCKTFYSTDIPVAYNALPFINSRIVVEDSIPVRDINIKNIVGTATSLADLRFVLRTPSGEFLDLLERDNCNSSEGYFFHIDMDATASVPCPFNVGETYPPEQSLNGLLGGQAAGTWRLFVYDGASEGELTNWELELCTTASLLVNSTPEPQRVDLRVFPNPTQRQLTVELPVSSRGWFELFDLQGRSLQRLFLDQTTTFELPSLPGGLYAYRWFAEDGSQVATGKLIVQ